MAAFPPAGEPRKREVLQHLRGLRHLRGGWSAHAGSLPRGFGLVNLQGIRKPAYFALWFLSQLLDCEVACDDARTFATAEGDGEAAILFYDDAVRQTADNKHLFNRAHEPLAAEPRCG